MAKFHRTLTRWPNDPEETFTVDCFFSLETTGLRSKTESFWCCIEDLSGGRGNSTRRRSLPYLEVVVGEREGDERNEGGLEMLEPGECLEAVENLRWGLGGLGGDWWMKEGEGKNQSLLKEGEVDSWESRDMVGLF